MSSLLSNLSRYRRIIAIGPRNAGKSVLLASMLDHLRKDFPGFLRPGGEWLRWGVGECPGDLPPFALDDILAEVADQGLWPEVTLEPAALRFEAIPASPWKRRLVLDFIDFPGEGLADFIGGGTFENWGERLLRRLPDPTDPPSIEAVQRYADLFAQDDEPDRDWLLRDWAGTILGATRRGRYLTSPSSLCGRVFDPDTRTAHEDFAPIPRERRSEIPGIVSAFEQAFAAYRETRVRPLEQLLAGADALIVPVDVAWILAGGASVLRDQAALLEALGDLLERLDSVLNRVASFLGRSFTPVDDGLFPGRLRTVVLAATKVDQFRPADRSHLEDLVRRLAAPVIRGAGGHGVRVLFTACAAIRSTVEDPGGDGGLRAFRNGEPVRILPPAVPDRWPDDWRRGDFVFESMDPRLARNGLYPPAQIHLDTILRSILQS